MVAVILLGHGSRDARAGAATHALAMELAAVMPGISVHVAYLDLLAPSLQQVVATLPAAAGPIVVVPLLLSHAFHARVDVPRAISALQREVLLADPIGPVTELAIAAADALPRGPLVLGAAGTSDTRAQRSLRGMAQAVASHTGYPVDVAFAAQATPAISDAIARIGAVGVIAFVLLPGVLPDRLVTAAHDAGVPITAPLSASDGLVAALRERVQAALARQASAGPQWAWPMCQ